MEYFDLGKRHAGFLNIYSNYLVMREFCLDKDAINAHVMQNRYVAKIENDEFVKSNDQTLLEAWLPHTTQQLDEAFNAFQQQMVVIFSSYIEETLESFVFAYFSAHQNNIYQHFNSDDQNRSEGYIKITELFAYEKLDDLKTSLVKKASSNVVSGKSKKKVLKKIESFTKSEMDNALKDQIIDLYEKRNLIVHENQKLFIDNLYIENIYDCCVELLKELGQLCQKKSVPINDPSGLL